MLLLELTLLRMGLGVECAGSVAEATQLLAAHRFDLCLTDMRLPDGEVGAQGRLALRGQLLVEELEKVERKEKGVEAEFFLFLSVLPSPECFFPPMMKSSNI